MISNTNLIISFSIVVLFLFLANVVARLLLYLVGEANKKIDFFWSLFTGLCVIVSIYAIFSTKGFTILLPLPFLLLILLKKLPNTESAPQDAGFNFLFRTSALVVQFCLFLYFLNYSESDMIKFVSGDFSIYYRTAELLNHTGVESLSFTLGERSIGALTPYHYGDIWIYAVFIKFFPNNPSLVFLTAFTILSFILTNGLYAFIKAQFPDNSGRKYVYLVLIFAGLFSAFKICYPFFILPDAEAYTLSIFNWGKVLLLSVLMIGLLKLSKIGQEFLLGTMACIAALMYLNAIPAIFMSVFILLFIRVIRGNISFISFLKNCTYYVGITILFMIIFYKMVPSLFNIPKSDSKPTSDVIALFTNKKYAKTAFNIFVGSFFQLFTLMPYFILLAAGIIIRERKFSIKAFFPKSDAYLLMGLLFFSGLASWALLYPITVDTVQFFHNILAPLYVIVISLVLFYLLIVVKNKMLSFAGLILVTISVIISASQAPFYVDKFNKNDWEKIKSYLKEAGSDENVLVNIQSVNNYQYWAVKKTDLYIPLNILCYKWSNYHNVALMSPFITVNEGSIYYKEEKNDIENSSFSKYYNDQKYKIAHSDSIMLKYITQNNVKYVTISHDTILPKFIKDVVKDSLILTKSNFNLYRLR